MIFDFLKKRHECRHLRVDINADEAYCPDCGALIKNKWFLVRCSSCNIKRTAHFEYESIKPDTKFCPNCGGSDFYIQELESVNFTDLHYAIFKKVIIPQSTHYTQQIWIEKEEYLPNQKKLIGFSNQTH